MPHIATNYLTNPKAPLGSWVCTRSSAIAPSTEKPTGDKTHSPNFCGQCVSFVTTVCPTLPLGTHAWKKSGEPVKGRTDVQAGTVIATFGADGHFSGHAAIYEGQSDQGLNVVDQWVTNAGEPVHKRLLRFGAPGNSNNGDNFFVVD